MLKKGEDKSLKPDREIKKGGEAVLKRYHFHGEGKYVPQNVVAKNLKEATTLWKKSKKLK